MKFKKSLMLSAAALCALVIVSGCNRGALRLYGAGGSFPSATTGISARTTHLQTVYIEQPEDKTAEYYGQSIAGTTWQGTRTDTLDHAMMKNIIYTELSREIKSAKIFSGIDSKKEINGLVLETEIRAFGSQVRGFIWSRIGGVSAFKFTLRRDDKVLFEKVYERVVRDGDDEYTGASFGVIEDAMRATMSDSYREVLKALFADLEKLKI